MNSLSDTKIWAMGNNTQVAWNKKLCFEARDVLYDCVDRQENGNKLRCPDELYAYEMWCPGEFRRSHTAQREKQKLDAQIYDPKWVESVNYGKQTISYGHKNSYQ